jgi:large subunit ribosomal protein L21
MMYAVIVTNGKQYKVSENDVLKIDKLEVEVGSVVQFDTVLAIGGADGTLRLGTPTVEGAKISAEVLEQKRDDKIIVFKKKRRHNYRRKNGHRQYITVLRILDVSGKGSTEKKAVMKSAPKGASAEGELVSKVEKKASKKPGKSTGPAKKTSGKSKDAKSSDKKKAATKK